ncbi:MAG: methyltransferase domain-containing protein [Gemmatimonadales bacterium]|jgi:ubiquinone/menaquinone biosynthesis C-methylase UbiE
MSDASLRRAYGFWAFFYDVIVGGIGYARRRSIETLAPLPGERVLLLGVGTGLDLPHLPRHARYDAVDLTAAMLRRARHRAERLDFPITLTEASAASLPFADGRFDAAILHLILAVVPDPAMALHEMERTLRPGGRAVVWDKMLPFGGRPSLLRRGAHALTHRHLTGFLLDLPATLAAAPSLRVTQREPSIFGGMWQVVLLEKAST